MYNYQTEFTWAQIIVIIVFLSLSFIGQYIIATECKYRYTIIIPIISLGVSVFKFYLDIASGNLEHILYYYIIVFITVTYCIIGILSRYKLIKDKSGNNDVIHLN